MRLPQGRFAAITETRGRVTRHHRHQHHPARSRCALRITFRSAKLPHPLREHAAIAEQRLSDCAAGIRNPDWNVGKVWLSPDAGPKQQEEIAVIAAALLQYASMLGAQEL